MSQWLTEHPGVLALLANLLILGLGWPVIKSMLTMYKDQVHELRVERDDYRAKLHAERNDHGACIAKIAELEARPDLGTIRLLIETQTEAMKGIGSSNQSIAETLRLHMADDHKAFVAINTSLDAGNTIAKRMVDLLIKHDNKVDRNLAKVVKLKTQKS